MFGPIARLPLAMTALAGALASGWALSAGPEHPFAPAAPEPARAALLAQCVAGSNEIAMGGKPALRKDRAAALPGHGRHAVCYAAILSTPDTAAD